MPSDAFKTLFVTCSQLEVQEVPDTESLPQLRVVKKGDGGASVRGEENVDDGERDPAVDEQVGAPGGVRLLRRGLHARRQADPDLRDGTTDLQVPGRGGVLVLKHSQG